MSRFSIRVRLTLWYSGVLLCGLALFGAGWWFAVQHRMLRGVDERLGQRMAGLQNVIEMEPPFPRGGEPLREGEPSRSAEPFREREFPHRGDFPRGDEFPRGNQRLGHELAEFANEVPDGRFIQVRDAAGNYILPSDIADLAPEFQLPAQAGFRPAFQTIRRGRRLYRVMIARVPFRAQTYDVLVADSLEDMQGISHDLRNLLLMTIPGVLLITCLGGYWIIGRALAPVDEITQVARSISVENLSRRLSVPEAGDELQRLSNTLNEMLERLEAAVKRITQFTADASHELRTPISLIRATADLALRRERDPQQYRVALEQIEIEADRMSRLTEDLLTLARADSNALDLPLGSADLNALVSDVIQQSQPLAEIRGVRLTAGLPASPAVAPVNEAALRRLLLILLDNALKHTAPGGIVSVSLNQDGDHVLLSVVDSGEGIEPDALPHIFERFYRADQSRHRTGGVGLGLSIAQTIARAHGTNILVETMPGVGSSFRLNLSSNGSRS